MNDSTALFRDIARRLLAVESDDLHSPPNVRQAVQVLDRLRASLTRLAGSDAFASLLRRSLALTQSKFPAASVLWINDTGSLEGLDALAEGKPSASVAAPCDALDPQCEAAVMIIAELLGLLVIFIGRALTLRLVREAWPDASLDELH